jgi:tetrahydromethanopterin S-methyltransferase subunit F
MELLVETVIIPGTEETGSFSQRAAEWTGEAFTRAQEAIAEVAKSTVETINNLTQLAARPDHLEIEFGLSFSGTGGIVLAGASAEATLKVTLAYDARRDPQQPQGPLPAART